MKYKKKPVVVEAFKYDGDLKGSDGEYYVPEWAVGAYERGILYYKDAGELYIKTLEGDHHVSFGDYVIKGVQGELYPCKPDIFEQTYDRVIEDYAESLQQGEKSDSPYDSPIETLPLFIVHEED